jgi:hypothetical protein
MKHSDLTSNNIAIKDANYFTTLQDQQQLTPKSHMMSDKTDTYYNQIQDNRNTLNAV